MLFGSTTCYAPNSCSDTDSGSDCDGEWWTAPNAYLNPSDRPGVVDAICKLQGRSNIVDPAHYMTLNLARKFKDARKKRLQKAKAARKAEAGGGSGPTSPLAAKKQPTILANGFSMYRGQRKESALVSAIDSEVAQALDATSGGDATLPSQTQPSFGAGTVDGCSPMGRPSLSSALFSRTPTAPMDMASPINSNAMQFTSPSGGSFGGFSPLNADPPGSSFSGFSPTASNNAFGVPPPAAAVGHSPTEPADDKQMWDRIIKRCNSYVPILTQQGKKALPLGERTELSSIISNDLSNQHAPTATSAGQSCPCSPLTGVVKDENYTAAATHMVPLHNGSAESSSAFFDSDAAKHTVDLAGTVDAVLSQCLD